MLKCKRKGFISKEKYFYTRRKGFLHLKEKDLFEKKSDQKKRKENFFYQPFWSYQHDETLTCDGLLKPDATYTKEMTDEVTKNFELCLETTTTK